jgi:ATP-dependent DNA helicase RecG
LTLSQLSVRFASCSGSTSSRCWPRYAGGRPPHELEGQALEFKEEDRDLKRTLDLLTDAVVCFANAEGGTIVLGVSNQAAANGGPLRGVSARLTADVVRRAVFEQTKPGLSVPVTVLEDGGSRFLVVTVPEGAVFYANARGTATRRVGADCMPFPPEQQRQAAAARGHIDWSAGAVDAGVEATSADEVRRLRRLLTLAGRDDLARTDDLKLLRDLRLMASDDRLTRAGLLLVGQEEELAKHIPAYGYAYQYRGTSGSEASARLRGRRPLLAAVDLLLESVSVRTRVHPITAAGGVQIQIHDYPTEAVRELVVNALVHRDYEQEGSVDLEHSPDWLSVTSPGGLVFGVTPDNILTHPSTPRHRLLLETVTALQVAERTGQGIDRTYREQLRSGKRPPSVNDDGLQVRVLVPGGTGNDAFARFVADADESVGGDVDALLAFAQLRERRNIGAADLGVLAQRSSSEAQSVLERLALAGLIEPTRRTARKPFPTYVLTAAALAAMGRAISYHSRQVDDIDRKVTDHVREYGHVTNQTLRRLFNMDIPVARDALRDLQQREVLLKLDPGRGGRGIRYGPGPRFELDPPTRVGAAKRRAHPDEPSSEVNGVLWPPDIES